MHGITWHRTLSSRSRMRPPEIPTRIGEELREALPRRALQRPAPVRKSSQMHPPERPTRIGKQLQVALARRATRAVATQCRTSLCTTCTTFRLFLSQEPTEHDARPTSSTAAALQAISAKPHFLGDHVWMVSRSCRRQTSAVDCIWVVSISLCGRTAACL